MTGRLTRVVLVVLALGGGVLLWQLVEAAGEVWAAVRAGPAPAAPVAAERPEPDAPKQEVRVIDLAEPVAPGTVTTIHERRREARRAWRASLEPEERERLREERRERREALTPEALEAQQARKLSVRSTLEGGPDLRTPVDLGSTSGPVEPARADAAPEAPDATTSGRAPVTPPPAPR